MIATIAKQKQSKDPMVWQLWERWISEIIADFWSIARVGVVSTLGLIGVVSLPRPFVFRLNLDDPHPVPWIRVKLSCVIGDTLYPHAQWRRIADLWEAYYPITGLDAERTDLLSRLQAGMKEFAVLLADHLPASLKGRSLRDALQVNQRHPQQLTSLFQSWQKIPAQMYQAQPALVFAALGQAKADGKLNPEDESDLLAKLLNYWAMRSTLDTSALCANMPWLPQTRKVKQPNRSIQS